MPADISSKRSYHQYLEGGGEMGELTRSFNWADTVIGAPDIWPQSLLTTVSIILNSKFPMFLWWGPDLIQFYNDAYRPSMGNEGKHPTALGQRGEDCWPEIWHVIKPMIDQVMSTGESTWSEDQLIPIYRNNRLEDVYWTFSYSRVIDEPGKHGGVLVICTETTEKVKILNDINEAKQDLEVAQAETKNERDRLHRFFMQAPAGVCIFDGPDLVFELVNPLYQQLFPGRNLVGKPVLEAVPEIKGQPIYDVLQNVYKTGKTFEGNELLVPLKRTDDGLVEDRYFNFIYQARYNSLGKVDGLMVFVIEVTESALSKQKIEESEKRFRNLVEQSPVALLVNRGDDLTFDIINQPMIDLIGKGDSVRGKALYDAIPELRGQPIVDQLFRTYQTGEQYIVNETPVILNKGDEPELRYFNVIYKALMEQDKITGVIEMAVEVTDQVKAKNELEKTKDTLRLSLLAAELGTFDMDLEKGTMEWDERCRELFGISHHNPVTYENDFANGLHPDDRERVLRVIADVFNKSVSNGDYDIEYRTVGAEDQKVRWVRAKGKTYFDADDKPVRFIGAVLDITEQKSDELRKNDFIGMVSHELKTPLTSLTALIQIMQGKANKNEDAFASNALEKSNAQVKKMSAMINGFLNVSRLESGKIDIQPQHFTISKLIEEMISEAELTMPTHAIKLIPCDPFTVNADRDKIGSVISNLLSNAVKYSPRGNEIEVKCEAADGVAKVSVKDSGMGIKPGDVPRIFERYYRVQSNHRQHISGFGIGLYLSAEIIERHGGQIGVESEAGVGSTFWFTLPLDG